MNNLNIWLAYVSYPVTTAAYLERSLRKLSNVTTIGPTLPDRLIDGWNLHNMKCPIIPHNIVTSFTPDMTEIIAATPPEQKPDVYIWVESVGGHFPTNLESIKCPKVCLLIDTHLSLEWHLKWATNFDHVFLVHLNYLEDIRRVNPNSHWLPVACDPEIHNPAISNTLHDISFVGSVQDGSRRASLLHSLSNSLPLHYERCFWDEMAEVFSSSKMVFNEAVKNDLNMRFFEVLSSGALLLSDMAVGSGQEILFRDGEDYACYKDNSIADTARFYLENDALRQQIARRGQRLVHNAHTYDHRVKDLLDVVINGKADTFSAEELRQISLQGVPEPFQEAQDSIHHGNQSRSFVIPVLDYSPASEYNITTLLNDLENIPGDVIVIFNSEEVANELKGHPRIDHYAIMKHNIGVARAWNIGIDIAETRTVFIVNADAHIRIEAVDALEQGLWNLEGAACTGPQGSFFNFDTCRDYHYFDKGSFNKPVKVDAVSGFFFCVKREHFSSKKLIFENAFTPCYFEEWDLGLQIKNNGLAAYVIPTTAYDHHWSGSIRALRTIPYYGRDETAGEILLRNRRLFISKWRELARNNGYDTCWESGWKEYLLGRINELSSSDLDSALELLTMFDKCFPCAAEAANLRRYFNLYLKKLDNN